MSEFDPPIDSKSSERSKGNAEDGVDNKADFQRIRDLLQQLNRSNAEKTSTGGSSSQYSSIGDLLAYDNNRHDQRAKSLSPTQDLTPQEGKLPPGTFAPENPILEELLTPDVNSVWQIAENLELLTQIVCDHISQHLNSEMERKSCHQSNRIFSHQAIAIHQIDSTSSDTSSSESEQALDVIELAQEIEQLLHHRLIYERERRGRSVGYLPW